MNSSWSLSGGFVDTSDLIVKAVHRIGVRVCGCAYKELGREDASYTSIWIHALAPLYRASGWPSCGL
eukprot:12895682-Prorocentrum_lima.AAC.1